MVLERKVLCLWWGLQVLKVFKKSSRLPRKYISLRDGCEAYEARHDDSAGKPGRWLRLEGARTTQHTPDAFEQRSSVGGQGQLRLSGPQQLQFGKGASVGQGISLNSHRDIVTTVLALHTYLL